jgi:hypothetical protein
MQHLVLTAVTSMVHGTFLHGPYLKKILYTFPRPQTDWIRGTLFIKYSPRRVRDAMCRYEQLGKSCVYQIPSPSNLLFVGGAFLRHGRIVERPRILKKIEIPQPSEGAYYFMK